jgi:hypothetical protein
MADTNYIGGENELAANNNYATTTSATPKVLRMLKSEYRNIDGIDFGNRGWLAGRGAGDTQADREVFKRHCYAALLPLINTGLISDVVIDIESSTKGTVGILVSYRDIPAGTIENLSLSPWGK